MAKDSLARGARSANFGSMSHISQSKWDAMFQPEPPPNPQQSSEERKTEEKTEE